MSWKVHDAYCPACDAFEEVVYRQSDGLGQCPSCGGERRVAWRAGSRTPAVAVFKPINLGYTTVHSQAELRAEIEDIRRRFPHKKEVVVEGWDEAAARRDAEEHKHRAVEKRRRNSIEEKMVGEYSETARRVGDEAAAQALRANQDPAAASKAATEAMPSLKQLVSGG